MCQWADETIDRSWAVRLEGGVRRGCERAFADHGVAEGSFKPFRGCTASRYELSLPRNRFIPIRLVVGKSCRAKPCGLSSARVSVSILQMDTGPSIR